MAPDALTPETGMLRTEIDRAIATAVLQQRLQTSGEMGAVNEQLGQIRVHGANVDAKLEAQGKEITAQGVQLSAVQQGVKNLDAGQIEILRRIADLAHEQETITEETADGVKVTKRVKSWSSVGADLRSLWPKLLAGYVGFKLIGGWLTDHGLTWESVWRMHK